MSFSAETIFEAIALPEKAQRDIPRVMNRLLGQTFLYQDVENDKEDYYFVHRHRTVFSSLFAVSGFTLLHDDYHRIFQVISDLPSFSAGGGLSLPPVQSPRPTQRYFSGQNCEGVGL